MWLSACNAHLITAVDDDRNLQSVPGGYLLLPRGWRVPRHQPLRASARYFALCCHTFHRPPRPPASRSGTVAARNPMASPIAALVAGDIARWALTAALADGFLTTTP
ncbi:hypothetical protein ABZP36_023712 [Zizania latifolia]